MIPVSITAAGPLAGSPGSVRPSDVLRSLAFYVVFYCGSIIHVGLASLLLVLGSHRRFHWMAEAWSGWHRLCAHYILGIRLKIEGAPPPGPVLIAIKHESFFEAIDLPRLLDQPVVFAKAELLRIPLWGKVGARFGLVEVARDQGAKALRQMLTEARDLTRDGRPLAIFPEGTRVPHGTQPQLQSGFAAMYKLLGLPVVPVAVNSGPLYHRRWKRSGTITIRFGDVIPAGLPRDLVEQQVHAAINALNPLAAE